jgi:hypothetical protein
MRRLLILGLYVVAATILTAFTLDNAIVPKEEILSGGPTKDGIPAMLKPKFIQAEKTDFLKADDQIIGVGIGNQAKAYPIKILNWHEAANDTINGLPIVVTF